MVQTRWTRYAARLGAVPLVAAGVAWLWAAAQRWWPECRLGSYESRRCLVLQDHLYDYVLPSEPWVSIGSAASLAGVGCLLLAAGLVLLLPSVAANPRPRVVAAVLGVHALVLIPIGAATLQSGRTGRPVEVPLLGAATTVWALLLPWALAALAFYLGVNGAGANGWRRLLPLVVSLLFASPVVEFVLMLMTYSSHDTPPWSGVLSGAALVVAGFAAWWVPDPAPSGRKGDRERRVAGVAL